jgi:hypothetical protein
MMESLNGFGSGRRALRQIQKELGQFNLGFRGQVFPAVAGARHCEPYRARPLFDVILELMALDELDGLGLRMFPLKLAGIATNLPDAMMRFGLVRLFNPFHSKQYGHNNYNSIERTRFCANPTSLGDYLSATVDTVSEPFVQSSFRLLKVNGKTMTGVRRLV